jgi:hypothetical protein
MIKRLVKLQFQENQVENFLQIFAETKSQIRHFPGCRHLELWRTGNTFFTYSIWDDEAALENYRHSELFKTTWARTKVLFAEKAEAWSVQMIDQVT